MLTNKFVGIPIFAVVMFGVFYISQSTVGTWIADWLVGCIEAFQGWVAGLVEGANPFLQALLVDGIIGGVGAVVGFLPLVMVMYFPDCSFGRLRIYGSRYCGFRSIFKRVWFIRKVCNPYGDRNRMRYSGYHACRTIRNERERRATAMLTPFMPCGAKLPVIALFAGAFFADASWVGPTMYLAGAVLIFLGALLVKKITGYKFRKSFFIIELPEYKIPSLKRATLLCFLAVRHTL